MDEAVSLIDTEPSHGTVITADYQSSGRGRGAESHWESQLGANLLMTIMLRQVCTEAQATTVPLRIGCAVAEVAAIHGLKPSIKWPNDVLIRGRKLAGVLCTVKRDWLLVGIGVNCNQRSFVPEVGQATSFAHCLGRSVDRATVESEVLAATYRLLSATDWLDCLRMWLVGVGELVQVDQGRRTIVGVLLGIDSGGALLVGPGQSSNVREVTRVLSGSLTLSC